MHLADAFIQSDLQCIQAIHLYCQYVCSLGLLISSQFSPPHTQDLQPTRSTAQTPIFSFCPLTKAEVSKLLLSSHPTTCPLDPIPSYLLQAISPALLPALTHIINTSLLTGIFPTAFKQARVTPLLKKPTLNTSLIENYRPVSLLSFIEKMLEQAVFNQVSLFLSQNNKQDAKQSGFRSDHSTKTALLSVTETLRIAKADSKSSVLILLDLSAAFDTVNHQILLFTLSSLDITGIPLCWFESSLACLSRWPGEERYPKHINWSLGFLRDRFLDLSSSPHTLHHWVPSYKHMVSHTMATLMTHSFTIHLGSSTITPSSSVRNLGVIFDDQLTFKEHIAKIARSCRFALHNIRKIRPFLTEHATQLLVQALVISRLDYCNALLAGLPSNTIKPLQMIQNAAARLVFNEPKEPMLHLSLSPCTGYQLQLASSSRHWCLHIEQPQAQHPPTSTHWWQSTSPPQVWDLLVSDASWHHHREAQNHSPEHSRSPFLAGGMISPPPIWTAGSLTIFNSNNRKLISFDTTWLHPK